MACGDSSPTLERRLWGSMPEAIAVVGLTELEDRFDRFEVCFDGTDQPNGSLILHSQTSERIDVGFKTTGTLGVATKRTIIEPRSTFELRIELLGIPKNPNNVGTLSITDPSGKRVAGPFVADLFVDAHLMQIEPVEWHLGSPIVVLFNPTPFAAAVHWSSEGRWGSEELLSTLPPSSRVKFPLIPRRGSSTPLPRGVAARLTLDGHHCGWRDERVRHEKDPTIEIRDPISLMDRP